MVSSKNKQQNFRSSSVSQTGCRDTFVCRRYSSVCRQKILNLKFFMDVAMFLTASRGSCLIFPSLKTYLTQTLRDIILKYPYTVPPLSRIQDFEQPNIRLGGHNLSIFKGDSEWKRFLKAFEEGYLLIVHVIPFIRSHYDYSSIAN